MDIDVLAIKVRDLLIANQNMSAQIAELDRRLSALEPEKPATEPEPVAELQPEEHASDTPQAETPAGESQEAQEGDPAPTPAKEASEPGPGAPQRKGKP